MYMTTKKDIVFTLSHLRDYRKRLAKEIENLELEGCDLCFNTIDVWSEEYKKGRELLRKAEELRKQLTYINYQIRDWVKVLQSWKGA